MNNQNLEKGRPYRFQPGRSGNPGGRPRRRIVSDRFAEWTEVEVFEADRIRYGLPERIITYGDAIVYRTFRAALEGKADAVREIREAIEGKTGQRHEAPSGPSEVVVTFDNPPAKERLEEDDSSNDV